MVGIQDQNTPDILQTALAAQAIIVLHDLLKLLGSYGVGACNSVVIIRRQHMLGRLGRDEKLGIRFAQDCSFTPLINNLQKHKGGQQNNRNHGGHHPEL